MKIAFVIDSLRFGGAQKTSIDLYNALSENGHDIDFITYRKDNTFKYKSNIKNKTVYIPGLSKKYFFDYFDRLLTKILGRLYGYFASFFYAYILQKKIKFSYYDAVFLISDSGFFPFHSIKHSNLFFIVHSHKSSQYLSNSATKFMNRWIMKKVFKNKRIVSITQEIGNDLQQQFAVRDEQINTIPNIIDFHKIDELSNEKIDLNLDERFTYIAHLGRHSKEKKIEDLVHSFSLALKINNKLRLILIGEGPETGNIKHLIRNMALADKIIFTGFQQNPYPILKKVKLLVLCSEREGLPTVLIEALSLETNTISSNCISGPHEIFREKLHKYIFEIGDLKGMSELILLKTRHDSFPDKQLISDIRLRYSKETVTERYKEILNDKQS
tara:strand:+ start:872 stop:2026 length:1155 start_codon:yes stop_codon:yes gene_type:complete